MTPPFSSFVYPFVRMRYTRFHAAKALKAQPLSGRYAITGNLSTRRSSLVAEAVALACAGILLGLTLFFHRAELLHGARHLSLTLATTLGFAVLARLARGVSNSGALAGAVAAFILALRDIRIFVLLLIVFCITLAATRLGNSRKQQLELAEPAAGRSASQVMANLGVAALLLALPSFPSACLLALAALAELSADTTSSEVGTALAGKTVLITNLKSVPAGTDGGISLSGTAAGVLAAIIIAACAGAFGLIPWTGVVVISCAATAGMLADSLLGATVERRGYLNNDLVNLVSTAFAALLAWMMR